MKRRRLLALGAAAAIVGALAAVPPANADIESYAIVHDDATLEIGGRTVRLFGIHVPAGERVCRSSVRPVHCAPEAALALALRIQSFVRCQLLSRNRDRSWNGRCFVPAAGSVLEPDEDLAAFLLRRGLAVALPDAPFDYQALERIARAQERGLWSSAIRRVR